MESENTLDELISTVEALDSGTYPLTIRTGDVCSTLTNAATNYTLKGLITKFSSGLYEYILVATLGSAIYVGRLSSGVVANLYTYSGTKVV